MTLLLNNFDTFRVNSKFLALLVEIFDTLFKKKVLGHFFCSLPLYISIEHKENLYFENFWISFKIFDYQKVYLTYFWQIYVFYINKNWEWVSRFRNRE